MTRIVAYETTIRHGQLPEDGEETTRREVDLNHPRITGFEIFTRAAQAAIEHPNDRVFVEFVTSTS